VQDKYGFIWIGTYDGLNRYDGNKFKQYRHIPGTSNSISGNRILALLEWPERDELWIGTDGGGLNCYNLKTEQFKHYSVNPVCENSLTENQISCLHKTEVGLWIGTSDGPLLLTFSENNEATITRYKLTGNKNNGTILQQVLTITNDDLGNIIAGTAKGLYWKRVNEEDFKPVQTMDKNIKYVMKDEVGNIWVLSDTKIYFYSVSVQKMQNYLANPYILDFKSPDENRRIISVNENLLILATTKKVFWVRHNYNNYFFEEITFSKNNFFENNNLKTLMLDKSMNVWLTSLMDGVARFDLNAKSIYRYPLNHPQAEDKNFIQTIIVDSKNRMWIGLGNGLFVKEKNNGKTIKIERIDEIVYGVLEDKHNNIWITTLHNIYFAPQGNINQIKKLNEKYNLPKNIYPFNGPYAICQDKKRDIIWIGMRSGILQINNTGGEPVFCLNDIQPYESLHAINNITLIHFDENANSLLIGTKNAGILFANLSDIGDVEKIIPLDPLQLKEKEEHIWSMLKTSDNSVYIGTDSGLKKLTTDSVGNFQLGYIEGDSRLRTYKIVAIIEDNDQNLWLSTGMGLLRYSPKDGRVTQFFNTDGLNTNILSEGSMFDSKNNILYLGSIDGINIVDLSSLNENIIAPETQFTSLSVNNSTILLREKYNGRVIMESSIESTEKIVLKYNENNFTLEFASLHFSNPSKNSFFYKLQGFNNNWIYVNNEVRSATFTNIPSGKYTLLVKSANGDGVWSESRSLDITIKPAPWNTIWAYLFYITTIAILLYLIYKYVNDRRKIKNELFLKQIEHKKEIEITEAKLMYHTNITHELRTPLSLIIAPVNELLNKSYNDKYLNTQLNVIKNNANRLMQLINQFLDFRKIVNEKYTLNIRKENISVILDDIKNYFLSIAIQKKINIEYYNDLSSIYCWCDKEIITKICSNLLSNAIKYTDNQKRISIYAYQNHDNSKLYISIEDTGIGIEEKEFDKIFNRFYQIPGTLGGSGVGLNLSQQLALIHKGNISVKSRIGEGSIFTLEIPVGRNEYKEYEIKDSQPEADDNAITVDNESPMTEPQTKPIILVVEDNYELLDYMEKLLKENATVLMAKNGEEGYNMALNNIPDMIVSDIMMPVMDGIEMTKKCKENIATSHIPIILLTANVTQECEIEGLSYGADDYITKPFNAQILKLRIKNLLKLTQKEVKNINEGKAELNEKERLFLEKFESVVLENISKTEFGIEDICKTMYVSRMQLYRKMAAIIGKKPSQYLKEIKMKKAYELLKGKGLNITEVMYEVGYFNYSYFSNRFTEVNGISPREVLGMKK
jgi:signal transduction histidine kinase/DNA-binding response OmpR family regulator/ligand-binding sensor domain-containing protein